MRAVRTGYAALAAAALAALLGAAPPRACGQLSPARPSAGADTPPPARVAPDFERRDLTGHQIRLRDYRGKLVLLSFWATWCDPCRTEVPKFSAWQQKYRNNGLQVVGISMDDDAAPVVEFVGRLHLDYPIIVGDAELAESFGGVLGLPLAFLIDPRGRIVARFRGEPDLERMEAQIRSALPTPP